MTDDDGDDVVEDEPGYVCERCASSPVAAPRWPLDDDLPSAMPEALSHAIEASARCLEHDAQTIDRAHIEAAHLAFGPFAVPLMPWLASRARARTSTVHLEWECVRVWPAPEAFAGTIAFGEIARTLAARARHPRCHRSRDRRARARQVALGTASKSESRYTAFAAS